MCAGKMSRFYKAANPLLGEVLCFREVLSWVKQDAFFPIRLEMDSLLLMQALGSPITISSYFSTLIYDCKIL